jgi:ParB-like chromosome segregation protein Spo0J
MKKLNLNVIRIDGGTQPRERINMEAVGDYAEAVKVGIEFPPVIVFHDGAEYWLADGFHRWHAHKQAGKASIDADVRGGTLLDAKLLAVGANGAHGLRRSNEDKRRAVQMVLDEPAWSTWSDRAIAEACGVGAPFVAGIRRPEQLLKQQAARAKATEPPVDKRNPITPPQVTRESEAKPGKRELPAEPERTHADDSAELRDTVTELATENEQLRDRLAVEAMDASEEEKTHAAQTIAELRARVVTLEAENAALKSSRDGFMRENGELKKQVALWRRKAEKAEGAAA